MEERVDPDVWLKGGFGVAGCAFISTAIYFLGIF